ncbi:hypothetical protein ACFYWX_29805 [Streptomyces sp. NPDC002888]|uniref:hypothetical protein n=1 Tax=Streptomyces sp. NPDC002888 TaxID=3364668 RepID=UPI00367DC7A3
MSPLLRTPRSVTSPLAADEPTARVRAHLHEARSATREEKRRSLAFTLYGIALVGAFWGIPGLLAAARAGHSGQRPSAAMTDVVTSLPVTFPVVLLLVLLGMARAAVWRGPVLVDQPTVSWLLRTPVRRGPLLLPRLAASAGTTAAVGLALGAATGFLLYGSGPHPWPAATLAGAWAGVAAGVMTSAVGVCVERYDRHVLRHGARLFALAWTALAVVVAVAALAVSRGTPAWSAGLFLWSGPWGWSAQPLVAAMGGPAPWWGLGAALSVASLAALALLAVRETPLIPVGALRRRATVASAVATSLVMLDLRQARAGLPSLQESRSRPAVRLPPPRHPRLLVPWRDATALLRATGRLGWAAVWTTTAVALTVTAPQVREDARELVCVVAFVAQYLAAAQLTEPARLESDDVRRSAGLPWTARQLALWHALVPAVLLCAGLGIGAAVCASAGVARPGLAVLVGAVPAFVAAALVSSYRGVIPAHILVGTQTPMGSTAPVQTFVWYLRGPLAALIVTVPVLVSVVHDGTYSPLRLVVQLAAGAGGLWWAGRTAHRLLRG